MNFFLFQLVFNVLQMLDLIVREFEVFPLVDEQLDRAHVLDVTVREFDAALVAGDRVVVSLRIAADAAGGATATATTTALSK